MMKKQDFELSKVHASVTPGEALKMLRELQGFSQNQLAELTGIDQSNISSLERGTKAMGRDRALIFAKALHVHPAVLLFPDFDMQQVA